MSVLVWNHNDVLLLIETYRSHQNNFRDHTLRKNEVWDMIARAMNGVKKVGYFSGGVCQKKWSNMEIRYKEKKDKKGKTGRGGHHWPYFELMDGLLGCSASVRAVSSVVKPSSAPVVQLPPASVCQPSSSASHSLSSAAAVLPAVSSSATQPSTSAASLISPPSDSSDDELHDKEAMNSICAMGKSAKRRKVGQGNSGWGRKLYDDMEIWHNKIDKRLENLESMERERIGVLKEMKNLMKVWVDSVANRQRNEI